MPLAHLTTDTDEEELRASHMESEYNDIRQAFFEAFEKHVENHFMEIENKSTASTSPTPKNLAGIINDKGLFIPFVIKSEEGKGCLWCYPRI